MGEELKFYLSLGLFSSFNIDAGTKLLLKTIAQQKITPSSGKVLDSGCGTGVIALSLKKRFPDLNVTASDRDALALKFTEMNARLNRISSGGFTICSGLLPGSFGNPFFRTPEETADKYDLIVSNIPAKAGLPVISDFLSNCGNFLTEEGTVAIVIVSTLADAAEKILNESGAEITFSIADNKYRVFHFRPGENRISGKRFQDVYLRRQDRICGFFGLPEFDSVSYQTGLVLDTLKKYETPEGRILIWAPGTGHIPSAISKASKQKKVELWLAGRDLLQLKASASNIGSMPAQMLHLPTPSALVNGIDEHSVKLFIANLTAIPGAGIEQEIIDTALMLLPPKGMLLAAGKSSEIARLEKIKNTLNVVYSIKYRGFRVLLLEKLS